MEHNVVFTGVGGQGVLLAANALGEAAMAAGYETRVGEIHGMSQRGGSVLAHVRYGDGVYGPMVPTGKADVLVALEPMEALRYAHYLAPEGTILVNFETKDPFPVRYGDVTYPDEDELEAELAERGNLVRIEAVEVAREAGHAMAANVVLLGALSALYDMGFEPEELIEAVEALVPEKAREPNRKAFKLGREAVEAPVEQFL